MCRFLKPKPIIEKGQLSGSAHGIDPPEGIMCSDAIFIRWVFFGTIRFWFLLQTS